MRTWRNLGYVTSPVSASGPPLKYSDVQGVLTGVQLTSVDSAERLSELRDQLLAVLSITGGSSARWEVKRNKFLSGLPKLLKKLPVPETVSLAEHTKTKSDLKDAKIVIEEIQAERERLNLMVEKLSSAKDRKDVAAIKKAHQPAAETLDQLENLLSDRLQTLPKCVSFVVCKELGLKQQVKVEYFKDKDFADQIKDASDEQLVDIDDNGYCSLNMQHPKIKPTVKAYNELEKFLDSAPVDLFDSFETEHETPLSLANRKYWEWALDTRIKKVYA